MRSLIVKITCGAEAPERCSQGFTVAATAVAAGAEVSLWLTGDAAWFATPGPAEEFEVAAGTVTVCTQCALRRDLGPDDLLPGVRIAGAAAYVEEVLADGAQALVY